MPYRLLADLVVLLHFAFLVFVAGGGLLALRRPRVAWVHVPAFLWGAWIEFRGFVCPLTPLENRLRSLAGEEGYRDGFIDHYVAAVVYPDGLTRTHQLVLGVLVLAGNLVIYAFLWRRARRRMLDRK